VALTTRIESVSIDDMPSIARRWDDLVALQHCPDPLRRADWLTAWWRAFGAPRGRREALVLIARSADRIVGAAPLMLERFPGGLLMLRHLGNSSHWFDPDLLVDPSEAEARTALARAIGSVPCDLVVLEDLAGDSPTIGALTEAIPGSLVIDQGERRNRYRTSDPPPLGRRRKTTRNRMRVAERSGHRLEITTSGDPAEIVAGLDEALDLTQRVWRVRGDSSEVTHAAGRAYVREALAGLGHDQAVLTRVRAGGHLVAFDLALREGPCGVMYRGNWDPSSGISGAGWMSMLATMDHLIAAGAREIDFAKFDWPYKRHVTSQPAVGLVTVAVPRGARGSAALRLWRARPAMLAVRSRTRSGALRAKSTAGRIRTRGFGGGGASG